VYSQGQASPPLGGDVGPCRDPDPVEVRACVHDPPCSGVAVESPGGDRWPLAGDTRRHPVGIGGARYSASRTNSKSAMLAGAWQGGRVWGRGLSAGRSRRDPRWSGAGWMVRGGRPARAERGHVVTGLVDSLASGRLCLLARALAGPLGTNPGRRGFPLASRGLSGQFPGWTPARSSDRSQAKVAHPRLLEWARREAC